MQVGQFQSYSPQVSYGGLQAPTINPYGAGGSNPSSGMNMLGMMFSLMQSLAQLSQGWGSFGGGGFGGQQPVDYASMHFPNLQNYNPNGTSTGYGGGGTGGTGAALWEAGMVLCDYIRAHPALFANKRVLELGAGNGLQGVVLSRLPQPPASITLTDHHPSVLRLMARHGLPLPALIRDEFRGDAQTLLLVRCRRGWVQ